MATEVKKRTYVSPGRQAKADATRARIIAAATASFLEMGYRRSSVTAIARGAKTSEASVFAVFGSKAELLVAVVRDHVIRDRDLPLAGQPGWPGFAASPHKAPAIEAFARVVRRAHDRSWRLLAVALAAAQDDPAVAEAMGRAAEGRLADCAWFVRTVIGVGDQDRADRTIDEVWTLISVENYRHLVVERRWPPERYESWLSAMLAATLR